MEIANQEFGSEPQSRLGVISLDGFKTICDQTLTLTQRNILIGANGAGKSNLLSFFSMLNWMTASGGGLQEFVNMNGQASALLHDGPEVTERIRARLHFKTPKGLNDYQIRLAYAAGDRLIFTEENFRFDKDGAAHSPNWINLAPGNLESGLDAFAKSADPAAKTARVILMLLRRCAVYQFHNTSFTSRIRQTWDVEDNRFLKSDAGNLAPFLFRLRQQEPSAYDRILATTRDVAPFFRDFEFAPRSGKLLLQWRERGSDLVFGAHQASDGTLRAIALITLLLQPASGLPALLLVDEPELGLNPAAIAVIAGLLKAVSVRSQIVVATQSPLLVDAFEPDDIIAVDRGVAEHDLYGRCSRYRRQSAQELEGWLQDYSLGELWEKNVIGARPAQ